MTGLLAGIGSVVSAVGQWAVDVIAGWGYGGIAALMALESACIPIPSEVILPFGGFLASRGDITFWGAAVAGIVGGLIGSLAAYFVGRYGGVPVLLRYGRYVHITDKHVQQATHWFQRYGESTVFFSRVLPIIRTFISLPAGVGRMHLGKFVLYTVLGSIPWTIALTWAGWALRENWETLGNLFHRLDVGVGSAILIALAWAILRSRRARKTSA